MQANPYAYYPYTNGAQVPGRYPAPNEYRQTAPPFANPSFDRYASVSRGVYPPQNHLQPIRYPPTYTQRYMPPGPNTIPNGNYSQPQPQPQQVPQQSDQLQPPQPYYYNPYGANAAPTNEKTEAPKKGTKEYKDTAFTIAPEGAHSQTIKGLVSNDEINDLLKHKGTKVKVSKIYRISKTKPVIQPPDSSDEEILPPIQQPPPPPQPQYQAQPAPPVQRPISSSSSSSSRSSRCSTCSDCSCSDCDSRRRRRRRRPRRSHIDDDCPQCRAEREYERGRRRK